MNYFKSFGYVTCAHAVWFANDLKLAHYVKVSPSSTALSPLFPLHPPAHSLTRRPRSHPATPSGRK